MLIEHVYSDATIPDRQFPTNIPDLISSDLTIPHTIFICDHSHYHFTARDQRYFPVQVKFQSIPVNLQIVFLVAFNFVLL